jgi:hypothetical protein
VLERVDRISFKLISLYFGSLVSVGQEIHFIPNFSMAGTFTLITLIFQKKKEKKKRE